MTKNNGNILNQNHGDFLLFIKTTIIVLVILCLSNSCIGGDDEALDFAFRNITLTIIEDLNTNKISEKNREAVYRALIFDALVIHKKIYDPEKSVELLFSKLNNALGHEVTKKILNAKQYPQAMEDVLGEKILLDKNSRMSSIMLLHSDVDDIKKTYTADDLKNFNGTERLIHSMKAWIKRDPVLPNKLESKAKSIIHYLELDCSLLNRAAVDAYLDAKKHISTGKVPK